jgi:hypothetical protein
MSADRTPIWDLNGSEWDKDLVSIFYKTNMNTVNIHCRNRTPVMVKTCQIISLYDSDTSFLVLAKKKGWAMAHLSPAHAF